MVIGMGLFVLVYYVFVVGVVVKVDYRELVVIGVSF